MATFTYQSPSILYSPFFQGFVDVFLGMSTITRCIDKSWLGILQIRIGRESSRFTLLHQSSALKHLWTKRQEVASFTFYPTLDSPSCWRGVTTIPTTTIMNQKEASIGHGQLNTPDEFDNASARGKIFWVGSWILISASWLAPLMGP